MGRGNRIKEEQGSQDNRNGKNGLSKEKEQKEKGEGSLNLSLTKKRVSLCCPGTIADSFKGHPV